MLPQRKRAREKRWITLLATGVCMFIFGLLSGIGWDLHVTHALPESLQEGSDESLLLPVHADSSGACPYPYDRFTTDDIRQGQTPYIFGGARQPHCRHCGSDSTWSNFCKFDNTLPGNPACGKDRKKWLIDGFLERGFHDILTVTPCDLFQSVRGHTVWVVGDSQSNDMSKALQCFLHEFWDLKLYNASSIKPQLAPFLHQLRSAQCGDLVGNTRLCYLRADLPHTVLDLIIPLLMTMGHPHDILVLNVGLHYTPDYEKDLQKIAAVFREQQSKLPQLIWMDTPPQHFHTEFGEYSKEISGPPYNCWYIGKANNKDPLRLTSDHYLSTIDPKYQSVVDGGWRNVVSRAVMAAADIPVLQIWNESTALWNYHRDNGAGWECSHYCFPSAPQVWVYHLLVKLQELQSV